jgi:hypothetical protein
MSLGKQPASLVLVITEIKVILLLWDGQQLLKLHKMQNAPDSAETYTRILGEHPDLPVVLVTDLIEESFRQDTIVHVSGSDRDALLKRKLDFTFRNTPFRVARVTGRNKEGRRDDRILLSALIRPDSISSWVNILTREKRAVQTISSIAFILNDYLVIEKLKDEKFLLIINHIENSLRQSFFSNGQLLFSRLSSMNIRSVDQTGNDIYQETMQVRQYLERIQFIPYSAPLRIQVFSGDQDALDQIKTRTNETNSIETINAQQLLQNAGSALAGEPGCATYLQLSRVLGAAKPGNVYAPPSTTRIFDLKAFARGLSLAAGVFLLVGIGMNLPGAMSLAEQWEQREITEARTLPLQREYNQLTESFPATPIPSRQMELVVQTYETLAAQNRSPQTALNMLSDALARSPGLQINLIDWNLVAEPFEPYIDEFGTNHAAPEPYPGLSPDDVRSILLQNRSIIELSITGEAYSPNSFREAQDQVLTLAEALEAQEGVSVFADRLPTDVRTDTQVSTTVDDGEVRAEFKLTITIDDRIKEAQPAAQEEFL